MTRATFRAWLADFAPLAGVVAGIYLMAVASPYIAVVMAVMGLAAIYVMVMHEGGGR